MFVCCECCVLSCDGLITRPEESYQLWRFVVCDQETSKTRRLKPASGLWKIHPQWVIRPGKQTNNKRDLKYDMGIKNAVYRLLGRNAVLSERYKRSGGRW
jgi:hypothetical protein